LQHVLENQEKKIKSKWGGTGDGESDAENGYIRLENKCW
jgi:hypothetical protein